MPPDSKYCGKCGSPLTDNAAFCAKCGSPVLPARSQPIVPAVPQPQVHRNEKNEKAEKSEKSEKGEKNEKGRGGNIMGPLVGGLILVWLGVTLYAQQSGLIASDNWWAYFIVGIGVILMIQGLVGYASGRRPLIGSLIGGGILLIVGLSFIANVSANLWPLIFVVIGVALLVSSLSMRKRTPAP